MARLKRTTLSEQLVTVITKEIAAGVWRDRLPGYRVLGKRYDVSRPTCESAMRILEANGVIGAATAGKMRIIRHKKARKQTSATLHLLIVIDSRHPPTPLDAELLIQIEGFWKAEGGDVNHVECDLMRSRKPTYMLKKWIKMSGADCVLFETISHEWIMPLEKSGLPCYAMGGSVRQGTGVLSGSGFRIIQCIENLLREALELGHRRILLVLGRATSEEAMRNAIQIATTPILEENWGNEAIDFSVMIPDLVNPSDWHDWWQTTLLRERPTMVLTESAFQAICLHNFCLDRGIRMPRDMSMVVLDDADFLEWLNPSPTRYRHKTEEVFRHFRSWVRGEFTQGSIKVFGAKLAGGKTLGSAPKHKR